MSLVLLNSYSYIERHPYMPTYLFTVELAIVAAVVAFYVCIISNAIINIITMMILLLVQIKNKGKIVFYLSP
uniref:Uncharacterized protein n=1 Tax=Glossina palpalis gambiensis TaxID=67801 RepID=A0A1B0BC37_9MUSC